MGKPDFFAAVFGAGLAGLSVAHALLKKGKSVLLIDTGSEKAASRTLTGALANPATGRRAGKSWESEKCLLALKNTLSEVAQFSGRADFFRETGVIRPAVNEELAEYFQKSVTGQNWPDGWVRWLDKEKLMETHPHLGPHVGGLEVTVGISVFADVYLKCYLEYLQHLGAGFWDSQTIYEKSGQNFLLPTVGNSAIAENVIVAAGAGWGAFSEWRNLPLHPVKGELAVFELEKPAPFGQAVSSLGYIIPQGKFLHVGSTYEHHFKDAGISEKAKKILTEKLQIMLPGLSDEAKLVRQISGVRVSTPNRLPVLGPHPEISNLFLFTGLGSKGLLYSEYAGSLLVGFITGESELPDEVSTGRFYK